MTKKKIFIILAAIVLLGFLVVLIRGKEDDWICVKGEWIKHGNPSRLMPTSDCAK